MDLINPEQIRSLLNYFLIFYWCTMPIILIWCLFTDNELTGEGSE